MRSHERKKSSQQSFPTLPVSGDGSTGPTSRRQPPINSELTPRLESERRRRRKTAPQTDNGDLFLTMANDGPPSSTDNIQVSSGQRKSAASNSADFTSSSLAPDASSQHLPSNGDITPKAESPATARDWLLGTPNHEKSMQSSFVQTEPKQGHEQNESPSSDNRNRLRPLHLPSRVLGQTATSRSYRRSELTTADEKRISGSFASTKTRMNGGSKIGVPADLKPSSAKRDVSPNPSAADGTESVASTTAPSTIWDELDDLKSRIRRLESGRSTHARVVSSPLDAGERPRTATTMTTASSSSQSHSNPQPLLRTALEKSQRILEPGVFQSLEATAADALDIAALAARLIEQADPEAGSTPVERRIRRKADNLCRSLTEHCIALSEAKNDAQTSLRDRIGSVQYSKPQWSPAASGSPQIQSSPLSYVDSQAPARGERLPIAAGSWAHNRSDFRRSSTSSPLAKRHSMISSSPLTNDSTMTVSTARPLEHTRTTPLHANNDVLDSELGGELDFDPTVRVPSRAMTDVGRGGAAPRSFSYSGQRLTPDDLSRTAASANTRSLYANGVMDVGRNRSSRSLLEHEDVTTNELENERRQRLMERIERTRQQKKVASASQLAGSWKAEEPDREPSSTMRQTPRSRLRNSSAVAEDPSEE